MSPTIFNWLDQIAVKIMYSCFKLIKKGGENEKVISIQSIPFYMERESEYIQQKELHEYHN